MPSQVREKLDRLYALQVIDTQIQRAKKAQSVLDNGSKAAADTTAARAVQQLALTSLHHVSGELKDSELKLSALETKLKNYQQKLYQGSVTNAKELANIEKEIGALGRQRSDLDERILELMDEAEKKKAESHLATAKADESEQHAQTVSAKFRADYEAYDLKLKSLAPQRLEAAAQIEDKNLLKRYEDIRAKAGGIGIAKIIEGSCEGCHMTLPSGLVRSVREDIDVQTCENCGRILVH